MKEIKQNEHINYRMPNRGIEQGRINRGWKRKRTRRKREGEEQDTGGARKRTRM